MPKLNIVFEATGRGHVLCRRFRPEDNSETDSVTYIENGIQPSRLSLTESLWDQFADAYRLEFGHDPT